MRFTSIHITVPVQVHMIDTHAIHHTHTICPFTAGYAMNLLSGLLIAEVAINQYEASPTSEVPSSFKEFADVNLQSKLAGNCISAIALFINTCVLSFDLVRAGEMMSQAITNNDALKPIFSQELLNGLSSGNAGLFASAAFFTALVATQSGAVLSGIASVCCITLFCCFAGLVVPGLAMIQDPLATFTAQGTSAFGSEVFMHDISTFVPVLLTSMVYQNIVPTITKMLNYDRKQTVMAITLGSGIPMIMYLAFCFTVLGGGAVAGAGNGSMFLNGIMASSVFGSAMACVISVSEELDCYFVPPKDPECETDDSSIASAAPVVTNDDTASFPSVVMGVAPPLMAGVYFSGGDGFVQALSISGSYGTPLLYGVVPVILAFTQRTAILNALKGNSAVENAKTIFDSIMSNDTDKDKQVVPGGMVSIGALAAAAGTLMSTHLMEDLSSLVASTATM